MSHEFVSRTRENLIELMSRRLDDLRLAVVILDGIELKGRCCVVALGIDTDEALLRLDRRHLADHSRLQPRLLKR